MSGMFLPPHLVPNGGQPPPKGAAQIAAPMNDVQLLTLAAAQFHERLDPAAAVDRAAALFAEAIALQQTTPLSDLVQAAIRRRQVRATAER